MELIRRWVPLMLVSGITLALQLWLIRRCIRDTAYRHWMGIAFAFSALILGGNILTGSNRVARSLDPVAVSYLHASGLTLFVLTLGCFFLVILKPHKRHNPGRRQVLQMARTAFAAAPLATFGYGAYVSRNRIEMKQVDIRLPGLPEAIDGLRIAQISDIHRGAFFSRRELDRAVGMINETRPHVAVVTGDLISFRGDPLDDCVSSLRQLRSDAGTFGCMGNHETYSGSTEYLTRLGMDSGIRFLRRHAIVLRFNGVNINLAGLDYQSLRQPYLNGMKELMVPDAINVLLQHNPDVFETAAAMGWDLTLAGHTHGGQITVEILSEQLNLARFYTPYVYGLYTSGNRAIYVNGGLGTVGVPVRVGVPPEVSVLRLCAT